jgi:hypothetical protein
MNTEEAEAIALVLELKYILPIFYEKSLLLCQTT